MWDAVCVSADLQIRLNNYKTKKVSHHTFYTINNSSLSDLFIHSGKARQGKFIYIAHFIHSGNSKCFTWKKLKSE